MWSPHHHRKTHSPAQELRRCAYRHQSIHNGIDRLQHAVQTIHNRRHHSSDVSPQIHLDIIKIEIRRAIQTVAFDSSALNSSEEKSKPNDGIAADPATLVSNQRQRHHWRKHVCVINHIVCGPEEGPLSRRQQNPIAWRVDHRHCSQHWG